MSDKPEWYESVCDREPLDREEEIRLARKMVNEGDQKARDILIESNLRFVFQQAKEIATDGIPLQDLFSAGVQGLIMAVDNFNPELGIKIISYAVRPIRWAMWDHVQRMQRPVSFPQGRCNENLYNKIDISLDYDYEEADDNPRNLLEIFSDRTTGDIEHSFIRDIAIPDILETALGIIDDRERRIIMMYYGLEDYRPYTLDEIGNVLGLSYQRCGQIKNSGIAKIKKHYGKLLEDFV